MKTGHRNTVELHRNKVELQVVVAGAQSSSQHHCSTVLLVLVNSRSDQFWFFANQMLHDLILLVNTESLVG